MGDEREIRERGARGYPTLAPGDDDTGIRFLDDLHANVGDLVRRPVAIDRRMDDGVIHVRHCVPGCIVYQRWAFLG